MTSLSDQVVIITGAGSGIGRAIAQVAAAHGAITCLVGRTRAKLEETVATIPPPSPATFVFPCDLSIDEQMDRLLADVKNQLGRVDGLILCAGSIAHGAIEEASIEDFDALYRANVRAPYRLVQCLLPMLKKRPGQIVFINSSVGLTAPANVSQFSSTQHALKAITDSLRGEVNSYGVRVLSVYPGRTATPRQEALYAKSRKEYRPELLLQPADIASVVINALTLPPTAEVTDISIRPLIKSY